MIEFELLEAAYTAVPEPTAASVARTRDALLAAIGARRRRRRRLALATGVSGAAAAVAAVGLVFLPGRAQGLSAKSIIRATYVATLPPANGIRHVRMVKTTSVLPGRREVVDEWFSVRPPLTLHTRSSAGNESEFTACGSLAYDPKLNVLSVTAWSSGATRFGLRLHADPLLAFEAAYNGHRVSYGGKMTFRGESAYKLVVDRGSATVTFIVTRDTFTPLRTIWSTRRETDVTTYLVFETLPRTARNEHVLHIAPHAHALLSHSGTFKPTKACKGFGTSDSLRGGKR